MVKYQSTRGHKETISFEDVILSGLAPDKGLYLPDSLTMCVPLTDSAPLLETTPWALTLREKKVKHKIVMTFSGE